MKKVIPKKKDAFLVILPEPVETDSSDFSKFQSPSFESLSVSPSSSSAVGIAGKNIHVGDVVMFDENGMIVPFVVSEGRSCV